MKGCPGGSSGGISRYCHVNLQCLTLGDDGVQYKLRKMT